jgi:hypothetical protein
MNDLTVSASGGGDNAAEPPKVIVTPVSVRGVFKPDTVFGGMLGENYVRDDVREFLARYILAVFNHDCRQPDGKIDFLKVDDDELDDSHYGPWIGSMTISQALVPICLEVCLERSGGSLETAIENLRAWLAELKVFVQAGNAVQATAHVHDGF